MLDKGNSEEDEEDSNIQGDQWKEVGPYLVVLLLPLAAFAFKRGLVFLLLVGLLSPPVMLKAHALQGSDVASERQSGIENSAQPKSLSWWQKPFMNDNQEALNSYQRGKYKDAVSQFDDKLWKASSLYKSGEYERALAAFENIPGPESLYNQGNALAKLGKLEKAIEKYELALQEAPDFEDAKANKKIIEDLLEQQAQQEKQNQQQNQQQGSDQNQNQDTQQNNGEDDQQQSGEPNNQDGEQNDNSDQQSGQNQQQNSTEQNGEQQNSDNAERSEDSEPSEPEQQEPSSQQDNADQGENAQQNSAPALNEEESSAQEAEAMQSQAGELSDAEKEELQRMESLMRRVPDDPAFLLKRKMQLEAQKRQRQRMPSNRSDW